MSRKPAPFVVARSGDFPNKWMLLGRNPGRFLGWFDTQAAAIEHAYRHWPWWP